MTSKAIIIWGSQLSVDHHSALQSQPQSVPVFLIEAKSVCIKRAYHKQKLAFILTAMREYADELRASGRSVHYVKLDDTDDTWFDSLGILCKQHEVSQLIAMRQNDRTPQDRLEAWCKQQKIELSITPNTLFLTPTSQFNEWAEGQKRLQMEQFYRWQRRRLNILMENDKPMGGRWNYDSENRKPLPKSHTPPELTFPKPSAHYQVVTKLVAEHFTDHPGTLEEHWLPTTRLQARDWLQQFISERFNNFGAYEDAMRHGETFLYHSALSALLNVGLLHAQEVIDAALKADVPLPAKEGFIRQIIGWREFMFGLYHFKPLDWKNDNFFDHRKQLPSWWWTLDAKAAPEPPLQDVLSRLRTYGYNHHIERLMVLGNYMLLSGYNPREVYEWFMTMYVDSYEWVMVPNVIGMSQYADGGQDNPDSNSFATKPYISGSNYLQKMGSWWSSAAAAKNSEWTTLYWQFLHRHEDKLSKNFRLQRLFSQAKKRA
jgi:deoxyribodipyrimidine photolyase-related protein